MRFALATLPFAVLVSAGPLLDAINPVSFAGAPSPWKSDSGLTKRGKDCINLRSNIGAKDCKAALSSNGFRGAFWYDSDKKGHVKANTNLATDTKVTQITSAETAGKGKFTCDHIMELNILKSVINYDGGACDEADALDPAEARTKLEAIRAIVNRPKNLVSFTSPVENVKTKHTQVFQGVPAAGSGSDMVFLAMADYLEQTLSFSSETARLLDAEIQKQFPTAKTGVAALWSKYMAATEAEALLRRKAAQAEIDKKKKDAEAKAKAAAARKAACAGGPKPPSRPTTPTPRRMIRRHLLDSSPAPLSTLERRRIQKAARSGPNAPPAPSCPLPGAKQKKVVPRTQMKTKPKPAKTPRAPATTPKAKKPVPKKTVKRPASRPRRAPGKPATKKRVTPKKKPRKVPKPTKKAKGKARPRRR